MVNSSIIGDLSSNDDDDEIADDVEYDIVEFVDVVEPDRTVLHNRFKGLGHRIGDPSS